MPGARWRGRPRMAWMDNIKTPILGSRMAKEQSRGGDYRGDGGDTSPNIFVGGDANVNVPPTNCPFSYFIDICLMFASQIQLKI